MGRRGGRGVDEKRSSRMRPALDDVHINVIAERLLRCPPPADCSHTGREPPPTPAMVVRQVQVGKGISSVHDADLAGPAHAPTMGTHSPPAWPWRRGADGTFRPTTTTAITLRCATDGSLDAPRGPQIPSPGSMSEVRAESAQKALSTKRGEVHVQVRSSGSGPPWATGQWLGLEQGSSP